MNDLRYALRQLRRSPGFAAAAIVTLALGIGANSAIFSFVDNLLFRPLPYAEPERLVEVNHHYPSLNGLQASISVRGFELYQEELDALERLAVQTGWGVNLTGDGEPERLMGALVSVNFFRTLGVPPALGRDFLPEEAERGSHRVAILSDGLWRRRFGADPDAIGRAVRLNGEPYQIVGVMPRGFRPFYGRNAELFAPLAPTAEQREASFTNEWLTATGRLAPGATLGRARAEAGRLAGRLRVQEELPDDWNITVTPLDERARAGIRSALLVLLGAVAFVLLIACANVANLLLARAASRSREIAVRLALGAGRRHLVRQLFTEGLVLSLAGAAAGLLLAYATVGAVTGTEALAVPRIDEVSLDARVVGFTALLAVATALLFALIPAFRSARTDVQGSLREGARGTSGDRSGVLVRRALVVLEFALAVSLVVGAGLMIKSFARLTSVDPGFRPERLLTFHLALPESEYTSDTARVAFHDRLLEELAALPDVESAATTTVLPFSGGWSTGSFTVEGHEPARGEPNPWGDIRIVSPDFARTMGIPVLRGRFLTEADAMGAERAVVVDEEMVRRFWPDRDPIGQRISFDEENWWSVVGVVGHTAHEGLDADPRVQLYFPARRLGPSGMWYVLRTRDRPLGVMPSVRATLRTVDEDQPVSEVATMEARMAEVVGPRRLSAVLLAAFAAVALLLAATGAYGVLSFAVHQRTRELGVRMAMGANRRAVLRMVMAQGLRLALLGVALGLAAALLLTRLLASQLYGVGAGDPSTFALVTLLLVGVATLSTLLPALRATRVDPLVALRAD